MISSVMPVAPTSVEGNWEYSIEDGMGTLNTIIHLWVKNKTSLEQLDLKREDIVLWLFIAYENQCNMEFSPTDLKALSDAELHFCISCWEKDSYIAFD